MNDIERVRGFGKTLKAFQTIADQLNEIADLQTTEKEAKRRTQEARLDFHKAMDDLLGANDKLKEANSLTEKAYKERDAIDTASKVNSKNMLSEVSRKTEDMLRNANNAADKIRSVTQSEITELLKERELINDEVVELRSILASLKSQMAKLRERLS